MNYNQSCAAKGEHFGRHQAHHLREGRDRLLQARFMQRAAVNIYKTDNSFEMLLFAPGRIKEHFQLKVSGSELTISYQPPTDFPRQEWIQREYSRGGFTRTFKLDDTIDATSIKAAYVDGVLQVSLPVIEGKESSSQEIKVS